MKRTLVVSTMAGSRAATRGTEGACQFVCLPVGRRTGAHGSGGLTWASSTEPAKHGRRAAAASARVAMFADVDRGACQRGAQSAIRSRSRARESGRPRKVDGRPRRAGGVDA